MDPVDHEPGPRTVQADDFETAPLELLTAAEAQRLLRVSSSWVYLAAKDGRIPSVRLGGPGGPLRFVRSDLLAHIEAARREWRPSERPSETLRRVGSDRRAG